MVTVLEMAFPNLVNSNCNLDQLIPSSEKEIFPKMRQNQVPEILNIMETKDLRISGSWIIIIYIYINRSLKKEKKYIKSLG